jgi:hypothetical protein
MKQQNEWKRHKRGKHKRNAKEGRKEETQRKDAKKKRKGGAENYGGVAQDEGGRNLVDSRNLASIHHPSRVTCTPGVLPSISVSSTPSGG